MLPPSFLLSFSFTAFSKLFFSSSSFSCFSFSSVHQNFKKQTLRKTTPKKSKYLILLSFTVHHLLSFSEITVPHSTTSAFTNSHQKTLFFLFFSLQCDGLVLLFFYFVSHSLEKRSLSLFVPPLRKVAFDATLLAATPPRRARSWASAVAASGGTTATCLINEFCLLSRFAF